MPSPSPAAANRRGIRQAVKAFHHRDFTMFWTGALVSNAGTWMQNVTVPYVLLELTHSPVWVGLSAFVQFLPGVILGPFAGSMADRLPRRTVLLWSQAGQAVLAMALWAAWVGHARRPALLLILVGLNGVISGLAVPAWQAFVSELVPRADLLNAVTLNSAQFNAARALGPAAGGVLLGLYGPSWAFLLNGLSFLAVIAALLMVAARPAGGAPKPDGGMLHQFADGLRYASRHTGIRVALAIVLAFSLLAMPVSTLIPIFAKRVYHVGAGRYGWLAAAYGVGAVIGAVIVGVAGDALRRGRLVVSALLLYVVALIGLGLVPTYVGGLLFVGMAGVSHLAVAAALNTSIQLLVAERVRGRVLAVYLMCLAAGFPIGSLIESWVAELSSVRTTVVGAGCLLALVPSYLLVRPRLVDSLDEHTHIRGAVVDVTLGAPGVA